MDWEKIRHPRPLSMSCTVLSQKNIPCAPSSGPHTRNRQQWRLQSRHRHWAHSHDPQVTIDDSKTYTKPFPYTINLRLFPNTDLIESFCVENEKDAAHAVKR